MKKPAPIEYLQHLFQREQNEELVKAADLLLTEEPGHVRALYWRACALMRMQKMDDALADLDKAILLFDEYADAYSQRGVIFFHKGELELALKDMNDAVEIEPDNPYRYSTRAYIKSSMNKVESAINDYQKAIALDPDDAVAHNNLGLLQEKLGYKAQAQKNFEQADRLMVNEEGELVNRPEPKSIMEENKEVSATYFQIVKRIFTSKAGFREYLNYLRNILLRK